MSKKKVAILISGRGSNMEALIKACQDVTFPASVELVISNKKEAYGLEIAQSYGIHTQSLNRKNFQNDATLGNRPEFGIWSNHSDAHGCGTTWDAYLRPVDRRQYYASGSHWQGGSEGGPCTGSYSSHQKHQQGL